MTDLSLTAVDEALVATAAAGDATPSAGPALADLGRGALVGRYVVLSKLGAGGMGVVFAAYDPELDRKVALKLLHPRLAADADAAPSSEARARLVREAQALAKLNHPHIVAIHDVGEHQGAVWLAMEYVEGETLSAWSRQQRRSWHEVLAVMTPAARGLSAAHDAGLVHRDIKPDNIMVGADGRVRVMDLGLARALGDDARATPASPIAETVSGRHFAALAAHVTRAGSMMGTPAYMSPEQFGSDPVDARADVFSFCVTSWEALYGERPFSGDTLVELAGNVLRGQIRAAPRDPQSRRVPGWLRRVCAQGLAVEPERRFASMQALLDALSRGQARSGVHKWLLGAGAVAALGASAALYRSYDRDERVAACEAAGASIFEEWNDEARAAVREGILATGISYAPVTVDKVMPVLDEQAEAWREQRTRVCVMADLEGTLDAETLDRADWCLDERRMELAALVAELSRADEAVVRQAVTAATGLPLVSPCGDPQVLAALPALPESRERADAVRTALSQARTSLSTGKYTAGLEQVRTAVADAEALGWPPMTAAARQLEGSLLARSGAYPEAEAASLEAYMEAAKAKAWDVAASAAVDLVLTAGHRQARHAEGKVWARHAEVAFLLAGKPLGLSEALRLHALAIVHNAAGAYAEAKALHERALAIREDALGPEHPLVATSLNSLARVHELTGAFAEAKALHERALRIREKALGPEHPDVAASLTNLAIAVHQGMGAYAEAKALFERALTIQEKALGPDHPDVAASLTGLAIVSQVTGAYAEAKPLFERALAIREKTLGPEHPELAGAVDNLATNLYLSGEFAKAKPLLERALAIREKALGPEHPDLGGTLNNLGSTLTRLGAYAEAKPLYERALAIGEKALGPEHPDLTHPLAGLARVHQDLGEYAEAKVLFERARAIGEKALGPEHPDVGITLGSLGDLALAQNHPAEALPLLERAVTIYDAHEGVQDQELATRFDLAKALARTGGDRTRMLAEARKAADGLREAGTAKAEELAAVEAFLAEHGNVP